MTDLLLQRGCSDFVAGWPEPFHLLRQPIARDSEKLGSVDLDALSPPYWSTGEIWALLEPTGRYVFWAEGVQVTTGYIDNPSGFHDLEIAYDTVTQTAELRIDGLRIFSHTSASAPAISHSGFHILESSGFSGARINDFEVRFTPTP